MFVTITVNCLKFTVTSNDRSYYYDFCKKEVILFFFFNIIVAKADCCKSIETIDIKNIYLMINKK